LATARGLVLSPKEARIGRTIREILCRSTADIADLLAALSPMEAKAVCARLDELEGEGIISWDGAIVALATDARVLSRIVAAALDPYEAFHKHNPARSLACAV